MERERRQQPPVDEKKLQMQKVSQQASNFEQTQKQIQ